MNDTLLDELINLIDKHGIKGFIGVLIVYSIISNLSKLNIDFDPSLILVNKAVYQSIFNQYSIQLMSRVPQETFYSLNEQRPPDNLGTNVYFDGEESVLGEYSVASMLNLVELGVTELYNHIYCTLNLLEKIPQTARIIRLVAKDELTNSANVIKTFDKFIPI